MAFSVAFFNWARTLLGVLVGSAASRTIHRYILLYCVVLHCILLLCVVLCCVVLHCIISYCIVLRCAISCCIVLYCVVSYCIQCSGFACMGAWEGWRSRDL